MKPKLQIVYIYHVDPFMFKSFVADIHVIKSFNIAFVVLEWSLLSFVTIEYESQKKEAGSIFPVKKTKNGKMISYWSLDIISRWCHLN